MPYRRTSSTGAAAGVGCFLIALWGTVVCVLLSISTLMFQYSLYTILGKDVPWYLDLLGGLALSVANFPIFVICLILRACGFEVPLYGG